jgi:hypothetical protein
VNIVRKIGKIIREVFFCVLGSALLSWGIATVITFIGCIPSSQRKWCTTTSLSTYFILSVLGGGCLFFGGIIYLRELKLLLQNSKKKIDQET